MNKCAEKGCRECALSLSDYCWRHIPDKNAYKDNLSDHIKKTNSIKGFYLRRLEFIGAQWQGIDAQAADLAGADLSESDLAAANMKGTNLTGVKLRLANLASVDFEDAHMLKCDLSLSRMWHAVIKNANISESDLSEADLLGVVFSNVKFWHVKLANARFITRYSFAGKRPIDDSGALSASEAYRSIKQYFISLGRYDDASWASFMEKNLQARYLLKEKNPACIPLFIMGLLCGFGEKPNRIITSSFSIIFFYGVLYRAVNLLQTPQELLGRALVFWDYLYFSVVTFTTVGFGDLTPKMFPFYQLLVATESLTGVFMMGLFVFTLARKYAAR
jgi:uncharacterized protein YjbI with pentapeptide repeats